MLDSLIVNCELNQKLAEVKELKFNSTAVFSFAVEKLRHCETAAVSRKYQSGGELWEARPCCCCCSLWSLQRVEPRCNIFKRNFNTTIWHAVAQLVEALCYKPEGRGFNSPSCQWDFSYFLICFSVTSQQKSPYGRAGIFTFFSMTRYS